MMTGTFAPDMVKWTKRDLDKMLKQDEKKEA